MSATFSNNCEPKESALPLDVTKRPVVAVSLPDSFPSRRSSRRSIIYFAKPKFVFCTKKFTLEILTIFYVLLFCYSGGSKLRKTENIFYVKDKLTPRWSAVQYLTKMSIF